LLLDEHTAPAARRGAKKNFCGYLGMICPNTHSVIFTDRLRQWVSFRFKENFRGYLGAMRLDIHK